LSNHRFPGSSRMHSPVLSCGRCGCQLGGHGAALANARKQLDDTWLCSKCRSRGKPAGRASCAVDAALTHGTRGAAATQQRSASIALASIRSSSGSSSTAPALLAVASVATEVAAAATGASNGNPWDPALVPAATAAAAQPTQRQCTNEILTKHANTNAHSRMMIDLRP
jgi:hypothetical protein